MNFLAWEGTQILWALGIFVAAIVGTLLPLAIQRHFSNTTDRLLAICSAFTGGVCSAVAFYLCQEGTRQLEGFWGLSKANKLGPCASIISYLTMYSIDFFGKYIEPQGRYVEIECNSEYLYKAPYEELQGVRALQTPLLGLRGGNSDPVVRATSPGHGWGNLGEHRGTAKAQANAKHYCWNHRKHHHSCRSISLGAPYLFSKSLNVQRKPVEVVRRRSSSVHRVAGHPSVEPESLEFNLTSTDNASGQLRLRTVRTSQPFRPACRSDTAESSPSYAEHDKQSSLYNEAAFPPKRLRFTEDTLSMGTEETERLQFPESCCESDEELCLEECSEQQLDCSHPLGLHPVQLFKAASTSLTRVFRGSDVRKPDESKPLSLVPLRVCCTPHEQLTGGPSKRYSGAADDVYQSFSGTRATLGRQDTSPSYTDSAAADSVSSTMQQPTLDSTTPRSTLDILGDDKKGLARLSCSPTTCLPNCVGVAVDEKQQEAAVGCAWVALLLFFCFSAHSLIEGVGLGSATEIGTLGTGVALHKTLAGFAVGASLLEARLSRSKTFCASITFALMTPIGTLLGSVISSFDSKQAYRGFCTAVAGGTFFYIALAELIPKAFKRNQNRLMKLIALLTGSCLVITSEFLLP